MSQTHKSILVLLALVLAAGFVAAPQAQAMDLTPEQAAQCFDLRQKFMDDSAALRKQMVVKRAEMAALWQAAAPDEKAILAKMKEMNELKAQLQEKFVPFRLQMRKICPKAMHGMGMGMGAGMMGMEMGCPMCMGMGHSMGPGHGMMGQGMGMMGGGGCMVPPAPAEKEAPAAKTPKK
jgi:hypothetical protein